MPFPNFDPFLIHIGPFGLRWYAMAYIAGIICGWRYALALVSNPRIWRGAAPTATRNQIDDFVLWVTVGIIAGGRLGSVLFYQLLQEPGLLIHDPLSVFRMWEGGMSFHGGLIGVTLAIILFARKNGIDLVRLADITAPCVPFGLGFGRLANFINGELWGRPTTLPWGIIFPRAGSLPRHPSQLYEMALEGVALWIVLRIATHGYKLLPRKGFVSGLFLAGYGVARIVLEGVREPDRGMPDFPLGLTMGMLLSIPLLLGGAWLIWRSLRADALAPTAPAIIDPAVTTPGALPPETPTDTFSALDEAATDAFAPVRSADDAARPA